MDRLYNLDYLRGFAALGIMIYHYSKWTFGEFSSESFMGRLGIYGVSIFYVLSGLTLFHVYYNKMLPSKSDILSFIKKRIFRILPLLWLVTITYIILSRQFPDLLKLFLNLTGLFGLFNWDDYYSTGSWSIGNELVFYIFFPFFIFFTKNSKITFIMLSIIIFSIYLYFAFNLLDDNKDLDEQWRNYVNPLNQVFLFLGGFLIGLLFQNISIKNFISLLILLSGICLFVFYPAKGDPINLVTGINRLAFTASCFLICISFYKISLKLPPLFHKPLTLLGEASYSLYLLHPIVYTIVSFALSLSGKYFFSFPESFQLIASIISTLVLSYLVYEYFEKYFMKIGNPKKTIVSPGL